MYKIICDSSCDIREYEGVDFESVPDVIYNEDNFFYDNEYLNIPEMLDHLEQYQGRTFTSGPSLQNWIDAFSETKDNYVVVLTGGVSGTYRTACQARDLFLEDYPKAKIHIFDTLSIGPEMKMIVDRIIYLKKRGYTSREICEDIEEYKHSVRLFLLYQSGGHLMENGRIPQDGTRVKGILTNNTLVRFTLDGKLEVLKKYRGDRKTISEIIKEMEKLGYSGGRVRITNAENPTFAQNLGRTIEKHYEEASIEIGEAGGLCSFYMERKGIMIAFETYNDTLL